MAAISVAVGRHPYFASTASGSHDGADRPGPVPQWTTFSVTVWNESRSPDNNKDGRALVTSAIGQGRLMSSASPLRARVTQYLSRPGLRGSAHCPFKLLSGSRRASPYSPGTPRS